MTRTQNDYCSQIFSFEKKNLAGLCCYFGGSCSWSLGIASSGRTGPPATACGLRLEIHERRSAKRRTDGIRRRRLAEAESPARLEHRRALFGIGSNRGQRRVPADRHRLGSAGICCSRNLAWEENICIN